MGLNLREYNGHYAYVNAQNRPIGIMQRGGTPESFQRRWQEAIDRKSTRPNTTLFRSMGLNLREYNGHYAYVNAQNRPIGIMQRGGTPESFQRRWQEAMIKDRDGATLYLFLGLSPQEGSDALKQAGIPGLKYLDGGSRGAGEGTRNYVIWDDSLIDIARKYGIGLATAIGLMKARQGETTQQ